MRTLSALADSLETSFGDALGGPVGLVSGGNCASLDWALSDADPGRIDDLRLEESILLGRDPLRREPIDALHTDAIRLIAEVIESKEKPPRSWGGVAQSVVGGVRRGLVSQAILGVGRQDIDPDDLRAPSGITVCGACGDHVVVESGHRCLDVGAEITFGPGYGTLRRVMASPLVSTFTGGVRDTAGAEEAPRASGTVTRLPYP